MQAVQLSRICLIIINNPMFMMGLGMMQAEMMIGAEMGMMMGAGMGMGMGMRGMGYCAPGCMGPCCINRVVVCPPGCMGPCCSNRRVIIVNQPASQAPVNQMPVNNRDPFANNILFPPQYPQQTYNNDSLQEQRVQLALQRRRQQEMAEKLRIQMEQLRVKKQEQRLEKAKLQMNMEYKNLGEQRAQLLANQQRINMQKQRMIQTDADVMKMNSFTPGLGPNPYQKQQQVLFQGDVYQKFGNQWRHFSGAILTAQSFLNISIQSIIKIKIKAQSQLTDTRIIKISTQGEDFFFSVYKQEQVEWMLKLIWAKITSMGVMCKISEPYNGHIEGNIVKKGFFGGWESKYGNITGQMLRISDQMGSPVQKTIAGVPQVWTRFGLINNSLLVVKMHHSGAKVELGIPIDHALGWLRGLYSLIKP